MGPPEDGPVLVGPHGAGQDFVCDTGVAGFEGGHGRQRKGRHRHWPLSEGGSAPADLGPTTTAAPTRFMNGVWQSRCGPGAALEPLPARPVRSAHQVRTGRTTNPPDPAVCPSGLGTRLQSELRGFDSRHGLKCLTRQTKGAAPRRGCRPFRSSVSVSVSVDRLSARGGF